MATGEYVSIFTGEEIDARLAQVPTIAATLLTKQDVINDLATIRSGAAAGATAYQKPQAGIPSSDMTSTVQTSLGKADSAYQKPSGGIPKTDLTTDLKNEIEGKADKDTEAVEGNLAQFDANGNPVDSGIPSTKIGEIEGKVTEIGNSMPIAEGIADTISAGTAQEFTFRKSGGDGVNYMKKIKGKTLAWNQLVGADTTEVTIPSGHKYFAVVNGTASVASSDGTALAVTGGQDMVVDLTLMGIASEISTAADFEALYPGIYPHNPGTLISNDAEAVETTGANQFDKDAVTGGKSIGDDGSVSDFNIRSISDYIPVFPSTNYYFGKSFSGTAAADHAWYDANKNLISVFRCYTNNNTIVESPANARYLRCTIENILLNEFIVNISNPAINGQYFPYWKRTLQLGITTRKDTDGNVPFADGMKGAGTAADWCDKIGGEKVMYKVDLGTITNWVKGTFTIYSDNNDVPLVGALICDKYAVQNSAITGDSPDKVIGISNAAGRITLRDSSITATTAEGIAEALSGTYIVVQRATPVPFTWKEPLPNAILVDSAGTEQVVYPVHEDEAPSAPFCCDSNYSISVKNLVAKLNALNG